MKKCALIINRYSGKGISDNDIEKLKSILTNNDYETDIHFTKCRGDGTNIIQELSNNIDIVISIGGDGTFSEVVVGNVKRKKPLLISHLPHGTTNDMARSFGFKTDLFKNLEAILTGEEIEIDVPSVNDIPFVYVCGYGKFLDIPYATPQKYKKVWGSFAYYYYGVIDFFKKLKTYHVTYKVDEFEFEGNYSILIISNSTSIAGFRKFYRSVELNDGKVEIALLEANKRHVLFKNMVQMAIVGATGADDAIRYTANRFELHFDHVEKLTWDLDGEEKEIHGKDFLFDVKYATKLKVPSRLEKTRNLNILKSIIKEKK